MLCTPRQVVPVASVCGHSSSTAFHHAYTNITQYVRGIRQNNNDLLFTACGKIRSGERGLDMDTCEHTHTTNIRAHEKTAGMGRLPDARPYFLFYILVHASQHISMHTRRTHTATKQHVRRTHMNRPKKNLRHVNIGGKIDRNHPVCCFSCFDSVPTGKREQTSSNAVNSCRANQARQTKNIWQMRV